MTQPANEEPLQPKTRRTWIFQGNPSRYRLAESLKQEAREYWNLRQHAGAVRAGDRILIWMCGDEAGIYAVGKVVTDPELRSDSSTGINYWHNKAEGIKPMARVQVEYERVLLDNPLRKMYLQADPQLWDLQILRMPRATNFTVSDAEWQAIKVWLDEGEGTDA